MIAVLIWIGIELVALAVILTVAYESKQKAKKERYLYFTEEEEKDACKILHRPKKRKRCDKR